ncbi:RHS repeat-associated core domain-containing protein [Nonomuraea sp. NBC_00507]|uniref:RHS repeat-associated core domain-containing protein n=1 Tax=Nonomuraea sp. NBC_00507 TaxID=2976002 RepID=UPI003FA52C19
MRREGACSPRIPGGTTLYLPSQEIRLAGSTKTATRYCGSNGVRSTTGGLMWTTTDHHGTNGLGFNAETLAKTQRRTTPFGAVRGTSPAWPTTKGFVGGTNDTTGLTHLGAREYDPGTGRLISDDPLSDLGDTQQINGYAYSSNTPTSASDASGMMREPDGGGSGGGSTCTGTPDRCADQSGKNGSTVVPPRGAAAAPQAAAAPRAWKRTTQTTRSSTRPPTARTEPS